MEVVLLLGMGCETRQQEPALRQMLLRSVAAALVVQAAGVAGVPAATSGSPPPPLPASAAALRCGGGTDVAADSTQLLDLFAFAKSVCCDQLGELNAGGGYLPASCNTPGCAHVIDLVESACTDGQGTWNDAFLGSAFGPMLNPVMKMCKDSHAEESFATYEEDDSVYAITSKNVDTGGPCMHPDCLLLSDHPVLPLIIIDGADELDGAVDCHTCGLSRNGESSCNTMCMQAGQAGMIPAAGSVGKSCSPEMPCKAGTYCDYNLEYLSHPQCQPCTSCAPQRWAVGTNTSLIDQLTLRAPSAWGIEVTVLSLYLPDHAQLRLEPDQFDSQDQHFGSTILRGKELPSEASRVIEASSGFLRLRLLSDKKDAGKPASFILKVDMLCTKSALHLGCGVHGDCGDDRKCTCHAGYTGHTCDTVDHYAPPPGR